MSDNNNTGHPTAPENNTANSACNSTQATQSSEPHESSTEEPQAFTAAPAKHWENLPHEMQILKQWCIADSTKAPRDSNLKNISKNNPSQWMTFEDACDAATKHNCDIGFVFTSNDPFTCIDLDVKDILSDKPKEARTTELELMQFNELVSVADSYTELSSSGRGTHIIVKGNWGAGRRKGCIEAYSENAFIVCTGNAILGIQYGQLKQGDTPREDCPVGFIPKYGVKSIRDGQHLISYVQTLLQSTEHQSEPLRDELQSKGDDEILKIAFNAHNSNKFKAHFEANWEAIGHKDHSKADMSLLQMLALYTNNNQQLTRLFLKSALGKRDKAKRADYLPRTIKRVRQLQATDKNKSREDIFDIENMRIKGKTIQEWITTTKTPHSSAKPSKYIKTIPLDEFEQQSTELDFVIDDVLERGQTYSMTGNTGAGKTAIGVTTALAVAIGWPWGNHDVQPGRVLYICAENPSDVRRRFITMRGHFGITGEYGKNIDIIQQSFILDDETLLELVEVVNVLQPILIIVDTDQAVSGADDENNNGERLKQAKRYRELTRCLSNPTVLVQTHPAKNPFKEALQPRGASSFLYEFSGNICVWRDPSKNPDLTEVFSDANKWRGNPFKLNFTKCMGYVVTKKKDNSKIPIPMYIPDTTDLQLLNKDSEHTEKLLELIDREYKKGVYVNPSTISPDFAHKVLEKDPDFPKNLSYGKTKYLLKKAETSGQIEIEEYKVKNRKTKNRYRVTTTGPENAPSVPCVPS